jgi:hypothetical protein
VHQSHLAFRALGRDYDCLPGFSFHGSHKLKQAASAEVRATQALSGHQTSSALVTPCFSLPFTTVAFSFLLQTSPSPERSPRPHLLTPVSILSVQTLSSALGKQRGTSSSSFPKAMGTSKGWGGCCWPPLFSPLPPLAEKLGIPGG